MLNQSRLHAPASVLSALFLLATASCLTEGIEEESLESEASAVRGETCRGKRGRCDAGGATDAPGSGDGGTADAGSSTPSTDAGTTTPGTTTDAGTTADAGTTTPGTTTPGTTTDAGTTTPPPSTSAKNCGATAAATSRVYYVATGGNDAADGSSGAPWATVTRAVEAAADGSTILVRPGTYTGMARLDRRFATGIVVRSEVPYAAKLRNSGIVVRSYYGQRITMEGFDIAHAGAGAQPVVVQIQSVDTANRTSHIVLRNNVIHDSYNNDIIKLNNGAENVRIEGNVFYNQTGSDEHIDVNSVRDCVVQDNIFFNDFAGSGRTNGSDTSAFIVVKDSNGSGDGVLGSERISIRRNVLLNWQGSAAYGLIQAGEDGTANYEVSGLMVENNLLLGNSASQMRSPFSAMGVKDVTFRHNTVVGNYPGGSTFGFAARLYTYGSNQPNQNIAFYNNVWSDPTGSMARFSVSPAGQTASFTLRNNLYWNGGSAIPTSSSDLMNVGSDTGARMGDPGLGAQGTVTPPRLSGTTFADGSTSICQAFERLVSTYGMPSSTSAALDAADAAQSPADDILARPRPGGTGNDLGAVQR